jgi:hypothetical protein
MAPLLAKAEGADRLEVRRAGAAAPEPPLLRVEGAAEVASLVAAVGIDGRESGDGCMCIGTFVCSFWCGDYRVLAFTLHHMERIRWDVGPWAGDAELTEASKDAIADWFTARGVPELRAELDDMRQRDAREGEEAVRRRERRRATLDEMADPARRLARICRILGANRSPWTAPDQDAQLEVQVHQDLSPQEIFAAFEILGDDRAAMLGAARVLWHVRGRGLPKEPQGWWRARLVEVVLEDGLDEDKPHALMMLWDEPGDDVEYLLRRVVAGTAGREMATRPGTDGEPGIRAGAAAALAAQRDADEWLLGWVRALRETAEDGRDQQALAATLAMLGETHLLEPALFRAASWTTASAAMKAVLRCGGREGLDLLIEHGLDHPLPGFANGVVGAVAHLAGRPWVQQYSWGGQRDPRYPTAVDAVRGWWREEGPAFVAARRGGRA